MMHKRFIGSDCDAKGNYTRLVDNIRIHGAYMSGGDLLDLVISDKTKYLVMDLDRTFHFGRNLGELLGWEVSAASCYGEKYMERVDPKRTAGRFLFNLQNLPATLKYALRGGRLWAYPGLFYLFAGKLAARAKWSQRLTYRMFGPHPVTVVQEIPRLAMMHHLTEFPLDTLREISRRLWRRSAGDQVFFREDFDALRKKYPRLKIIISSASPQPILEAAREDLGIDELIYSTIEEKGGYLSSPQFLYRYFMLGKMPRRISPPDKFKQNSSYMKITHLLERFPDILDPGVETVGITDTGYGEDHAWAHYFTRVVDVNSTAPFSPIVSADSPLAAIDSAQLLTRSEKEQRKHQAPSYLDPRRDVPELKSVKCDGTQLRERLKPMVDSLETLADAYHRESVAQQGRQQEIEQQISDLDGRISATVQDYNESKGQARANAFKQLRAILWKQNQQRRQLAKIQRKQAALMFAIEQKMAHSRKQLEVGM